MCQACVRKRSSEVIVERAGMGGRRNERWPDLL
jgi:hypothetical protein